MLSAPEGAERGVSNKLEEPSSPQQSDCWEILERLLQFLPLCNQGSQQIRATLEAVRAAVGADVVCWYLGPNSPPTDLIGTHDVTPQFVQGLLDAHSEATDELLCSQLPPEAPGAGDAAVSAVLVRVQKAHDAWIVALSFTTGHQFQTADLQFMRLARKILLSQNQQCMAKARVRDTLVGVVRCLSAAIDAKDPYTSGHSERVARIAQVIGKQMGLSGKLQSDLYLAGLLHDIGKIGVRDNVLLKKGKLTPAEMEHMQEHVVIGDRIISEMRQLTHLRAGVRNHHERFDGQGYPDGLAGEEIPLLARILAVADACDAMMSIRRYRPALLPPQIDAVLKQFAGTQWDPQIVEHFMACRRDIYPPIYRKGIGESAYHAVDMLVEAISDSSSGSFRAISKAPDSLD
jgi:HD-GYP domain-containing protein (c-di-GMP phosphodiesterase class II)